MSREPQKSVLPAPSHPAAHVFAPLQREIDRVFSDFSRGVAAFDLLGAAPNLDFSVTDTGVELTVEVPGLQEKDVQVTVEGDTLVVRGGKD